MSLNDLLERMHCCGQIGTINVDDDEDLKTAKQAILKDLLDMLKDEDVDVPYEREAFIRNQLRQELREAVRKYCE
jgi:hypothetical protein